LSLGFSTKFFQTVLKKPTPPLSKARPCPRYTPVRTALFSHRAVPWTRGGTKFFQRKICPAKIIRHLRRHFFYFFMSPGKNHQIFPVQKLSSAKFVCYEVFPPRYWFWGSNVWICADMAKHLNFCQGYPLLSLKLFNVTFLYAQLFHKA
jgi:hypothetical protein